jgi:hypothetical protein
MTSSEELKQVILQYGLIKGNDQINTLLVDRVVAILLREFELKRLNPVELVGGPIDLSASTKPTSSSSDSAPAKNDTGTEAQTPSRPKKSLEEQMAETKEAMARPLERPNNPPASQRLREGQTAAPSPQLSHFQGVIHKVTDSQSSVPRRDSSARSLSGSGDANSEESDVEVDESDSGVEGIVDVNDTDLAGLFPSGPPVVTNAKDAAALRRVLPKTLDSDEDPGERGKQRSIRRMS